VDEVGGRASGVAVISAWQDGDELVVRLTLSGPGRDPEIRVVSRADDVVAIVEEWLASVRPRTDHVS
jgi:hypothetical protein